MSKRACVYCQKEFPNDDKMVRSVLKGDWICLPCFEQKVVQHE